MIRFCDKDINATESTILDNYVVMNKAMWKNARYIFSHHKFIAHEHVLLPVLDHAGQLICYAYEDADADREIRMLRELISNPAALQFTDVFPEYSCVKIYDFNELAYFFYKYLEFVGIRVEVVGIWWHFFFGKKCHVSDYECLTIYAEGTVPKKKNWVENLLRSVSAEFECIDIIYESNLKEGIIKDVYESAGSLLDRLRGQKEVIIYGTGREEQNAYDFFVSQGIEVCCFVETSGESLHKFFGKEVISGLEARERYDHAIFIECNFRNSAWGFGKVDYYDYIGYRRNERFFLLKDYIDIPENNLINALRDTSVALIGNIFLCRCLFDYLRQHNILVLGYWDIEYESNRKMDLKDNSLQDIDAGTMCLIVLPEQFKGYWKRRQRQKKRQIELYLKEMGLHNYSDFFSYMTSFINIEAGNKVKYIKDVMPKRIVLGSIAESCGNIFFRGVLDGHPSVLMMDYDYSADSFLDTLHDNLFWVCVSLSAMDANDILPCFWDMYETEYIKGKENKRYVYDRAAFEEKMKQLLSYGERFTSQELFVMFHVAFMYMYGRDIKVCDIKNMIIYWEPHSIVRPILEDCVKWLGGDDAVCDILNLVRDSCIRNGSTIKFMLRGDVLSTQKVAYEYILEGGFDEKDYKQCQRLVVKFEDLKRSPRECLKEIFRNWGIIWSESCMSTTVHGKRISYDNGERKVSDFDIGPVYDNHEKYVSKFDQFRIMIATGSWQHKYGYSYMSIKGFTRKELQELFLKQFRFEQLIEYKEENIDSRIEAQKFIRDRLKQERMHEFFKGKENV